MLKSLSLWRRTKSVSMPGADHARITPLPLIVIPSYASGVTMSKTRTGNLNRGHGQTSLALQLFDPWHPPISKPSRFLAPFGTRNDISNIPLIWVTHTSVWSLPVWAPQAQVFSSTAHLIEPAANAPYGFSLRSNAHTEVCVTLSTGSRFTFPGQ